MKINGNTVLITGGATGIGYALTEAFLDRGNTVIICGRREHRLLEAQSRHPELYIKVCDVTDESSRNELFEWVKANFPETNILINNAGIQRHINFTKGAEELLAGQNEIRINLEAPIYLSAQFTPFLSGKKGAAIVNVSSGLGFFPAIQLPVYSSTKAGLHMFSVILRQQLVSLGIQVFEAIAPAIFDTELNIEGRKKDGTANLDIAAPTSAEYADVVLKGMETNEHEIGYGITNKWKTLSRSELDQMVIT